jgi:hypothetical protein
MTATVVTMISMTEIQMCAKYGLLDVVQYVPTAKEMTVASQRMMLSGMNWRTAYQVRCHERQQKVRVVPWGKAVP